MLLTLAAHACRGLKITPCPCPSLSQSFLQSSPLSSIYCVSGRCVHTQDEKKQFDRSSEKYYQSLEKKLGMSNKKKEAALSEVREWRRECVRRGGEDTYNETGGGGGEFEGEEDGLYGK